MGADGTDRARDPDLGVPVGGPLGRAGAGAVRGVDAGAAAAGGAVCRRHSPWLAIFMSAPGLIGTLTSFFGAGAADPSVATRLIDYPRVERLIYEAPWLGHGGGTYIPDNVFDILDNQYLKTGIELGLIGIVVLAAYFAGAGRRRSRSPGRAAATRSSGCCAPPWPAPAWPRAVCSLTFDSLSFPTFANVHALVIGLIGAGWRLAVGARAPAGVRAGSTPSRSRVPEPCCPREADRGPAGDLAEDLAPSDRHPAGDRPHPPWRDLRGRDQEPGVLGVLQLRPDQSPSPRRRRRRSPPIRRWDASTRTTRTPASRTSRWSSTCWRAS